MEVTGWQRVPWSDSSGVPSSRATESVQRFPATVMVPSPPASIEAVVPAEVPGSPNTEERVRAPSPNPRRCEPQPAIVGVVHIGIGVFVGRRALVHVLIAVRHEHPAVLVRIDPLARRGALRRRRWILGLGLIFALGWRRRLRRRRGRRLGRCGRWGLHRRRRLSRLRLRRRRLGPSLHLRIWIRRLGCLRNEVRLRIRAGNEQRANQGHEELPHSGQPQGSGAFTIKIHTEWHDRPRWHEYAVPPKGGHALLAQEMPFPHGRFSPRGRRDRQPVVVHTIPSDWRGRGL